MPDAHKNFAYSTVAIAPSPASSGTSLDVESGHGTRFPAVPFNAVIWPNGTRPLAVNAEVVRVTGISTDTLTIARTQEGSSARSVVVGDQIAAAITAKTLTDVEVNDGWMLDPNGWTYVSATSFKVTGTDVTASFSKGTRIRLKQGGGFKYFVVTAAAFSTDTTVTITGGTDYTLANAGITDNYYSYAANPQGWPTWFAYSPTIVGWAATPTVTAKFSVISDAVTVQVVVTGTSNATTTSFTLPITLGANIYNPFVPSMIRNNGTYAIGRMGASGSSTTVSCGISGTSDTWTASGLKEVYYYQTMQF